MQVVVKKPRVRLDGEITSELPVYLRDRYAMWKLSQMKEMS